jgi:hypothetical protein
MRFLFLITLLPSLSVCAEDAAFKAAVQPFLDAHCVACHGPDKQKAKLRLDTLSGDFANVATMSKWAEVLNQVNAHQMPPEDEPQPEVEVAGKFAQRVEEELAKAEIAKRSTQVVMRRMNRTEYNHTIRDLVGLDFHPADKFPEDPPAGGFDNIGQALTLSPMQIELYYDAAQQILDRALVEGPQPEGIKWRFEPEENTKGGDRYRVKRGKFDILLNDGENTTEEGFTVVHHESWNMGIGFRGFKVPAAGEYIIRFRAAGRIPTREALVESARSILDQRRNDQIKKNPKGQKWHDEAFEKDLKHFQTHRMYDYGPPRVKITQHLNGTPRVIAEMDIDAPATVPNTYEIRAYFTPQDAGVAMAYAYDIPKVLENFWCQGNMKFARPELLVDWIELEGPVHPAWPPASHQRLLPETKADEPAYVRQVLERFMAQAYRRPVQPDEVDAKCALFNKHRAEKPSFIEAIKLPLASVLASPHFLFLVEPEAAAKPPALNAYELASRLSYFLWSSLPDAELHRLAASGELLQPAVVAAQTQRMIADPKSAALVRNFTGQWLGLRKVGANPPATNLYPEYDRHLELSMVRESEGFFAEILRQKLDARQFLKSDFVTINERLARFYGIPGVKGDAIRRVGVTPEAHRGGIITQASVHCITSNGTRTSPVVRGVWILRTLLGSDPGLPVANVGEIASKVPGIDKATVRQRLAIHREAASCARCHDKIDPLGLALENYNACGEWRDQEGHGYQGRIEKDDPRIDASARMPDGSEFVGVSGLQEQLLKQEDLFLMTLVSQLTTYALGRELGFSDRAMLRQFVAKMKSKQYTLEALLEAIVTSDAFLSK